MPGSYEVLVPARWSEDARGEPRSERYGDIYHSAAGALPQALHVFLGGNRLPARWQGRAAFTLCELGFGLGQNFLATWQAWRDDPLRCPRLHYLAFEAHPFGVIDLRRACTRLPPSLQRLARALLDRWPVALVPGLHRIELEGGALTLTLAFGRIERLACQVQARVDAFYLDGFAPRVNPEMWSARVFGQMRRLAVAGATAATWCAAGQVRRDLQDAGFLVSRVPGFASKRDMTVAELRPGLGCAVDGVQPQPVAIVGGGLAGAGVAQALALRGDEVELWDPRGTEAWERDGVSAAGALIPACSPDDDTRSRLSRAGLMRAWARWMELPDEARPDPCGALVCSRDLSQEQLQRRCIERLQFPSAWMQYLEVAQARRVSGVELSRGGLWFPTALRVAFAPLIAALRATPSVRHRAERVAGIRRLSAGDWGLLDANGRVLGRAVHLVLAAGPQTLSLLSSAVSLEHFPRLGAAEPIAGQLSLYPLGEDAPGLPYCVLSGKGYCLPPRSGVSVVGSTYRLEASEAVADAAGHGEILDRLRRWLPRQALAGLQESHALGWAGWRLALKDHWPVIGEVPGCPRLWLASGYGSRGLSWSALAGDVVAATLHGEPLPLERELLHRIRVR